MNTHIEQLEQWWNGAEGVSPQEGDTIIYRESRPDGTHYYGLEVVEEDFAGDSNTRILHRAPKPKPAWHDAVAVIARYENSDTPQTFLRAGHLWFDHNGSNYTTDVLRDVTPLIEAKVTDEMVERYRDEETKWRLAGGPSHPSVANRLLTAALGIDD